MVAEHLSATNIRLFDERSKVFPLGCDYKELSEIRESNEKDKSQINVCFISKLYNFISYDVSFSLMEKLYQTGRNIKCQVITPSFSLRNLTPTQEKCFEIHTGCNRPEFLNLAVKNHILLNNSTYQDFSMTTVEALSLGLIGILPNVDWARYIMGDDYPFLFNSNEEALTMLKYCVDNYQEAYDMSVPRTLKRLEENFNIYNISDMILDVLDESLQEDMANSQFPLFGYNLALKVMPALPEKFTMDQFFNLFKSLTDFDIDPRRDLGTNSTSKLLYYRMLKAMGCKDLCDGEQPVMVKPKELKTPNVKEKSRYVNDDD